MAQTPKPGIPPDPNAGRNIHGQPNPPPDPNRPEISPPEQRQPPPSQVNIHGQGPRPNMAPPTEDQKGLADNTRAEMDAGKKNLEQYTKRDNAEHEAGRHTLGQHPQPEK